MPPRLHFLCENDWVKEVKISMNEGRRFTEALMCNYACMRMHKRNKVMTGNFFLLPLRFVLIDCEHCDTQSKKIGLDLKMWFSCLLPTCKSSRLKEKPKENVKSDFFVFIPILCAIKRFNFLNLWITTHHLSKTKK